VTDEHWKDELQQRQVMPGCTHSAAVANDTRHAGATYIVAAAVCISARVRTIGAAKMEIAGSQVTSATPAGIKIYSTGRQPMHVLRPAEGN